MSTIRRTLRTCAAGALLAFAALRPGKAEAVEPNMFVVCQAYCTVVTGACIAKGGASDYCAGFFSGCMTGCGF